MQVPAHSHWECQEPQLSAPFPGHAQGCVCKEQPDAFLFAELPVGTSKTGDSADVLVVMSL